MTGRVEDDVDGHGYSDLTAKEKEYYDLMMMGMPYQRDAARAMGVTPARITQLAHQAEKKHPDLNLKRHNVRTEQAIDYFHQGRNWREIAELCDYSSAASAYNTVMKYCGGMRNIWEWAGEPDDRVCSPSLRL